MYANFIQRHFHPFVSIKVSRWRHLRILNVVNVNELSKKILIPDAQETLHTLSGEENIRNREKCNRRKITMVKEKQKICYRMQNPIAPRATLDDNMRCVEICTAICIAFNNSALMRTTGEKRKPSLSCMYTKFSHPPKPTTIVIFSPPFYVPYQHESRRRENVRVARENAEWFFSLAGEISTFSLCCLYYSSFLQPTLSFHQTFRIESPFRL